MVFDGDIKNVAYSLASNLLKDKCPGGKEISNEERSLLVMIINNSKKINK